MCQYVDDTLVYRSVHDEADVITLQCNLNIVMNWAQEWQMSFNPRKTEFLRITNKHNYTPSSYYLHNTQIPLVDYVKYLGVIIDKNLNWLEHVNTISAKANSARGFLQRNLTKCPLSVKTLCMLYYNCVSNPQVCKYSLVTLPPT